jgi:hypothetical protein
MRIFPQVIALTIVFSSTVWAGPYALLARATVESSVKETDCPSYTGFDLSPEAYLAVTRGTSDLFNAVQTNFQVSSNDIQRLFNGVPEGEQLHAKTELFALVCKMLSDSQLPSPWKIWYMDVLYAALMSRSFPPLMEFPNGKRPSAVEPSQKPEAIVIGASVDALIAKMASANIAFNVPSPAKLDDATAVELRLNLRKSPSDLAGELLPTGTKETSRIKVSDTMTAHLTGDSFAITPNSPETQAISGMETTVWTWQIKPKTEGKQILVLTLDAIFYVNGSSTPRAIKTFSRTIEVQVTPAQRAKDFAKDNWQWLWTAILIPIGAWLFKKSKKIDTTS